MDILVVILVSALLGYLVFILWDDESEEGNILKDRLEKISRVSRPQTRIDSKSSGNFSEFLITFYFEPIILYFNKVKKKKDQDVDEEEEKKADPIRKVLMESGRPFSDDDILKFKAKQAFNGVLFFVISLLLGFIAFRNNFIMMLVCLFLGTFAGFRLPVMALKSEIKRRCTEIAYNLPDTLDLLIVCVEAGLGLDAAIARVSSEQMRTTPILARELGRVVKDTLAGVNRSDAFRNLAERNNVPDLRSFVALLVQTDKLGTSISQSLRVYADSVRTKRRQKAEKAASEASVKMVIPLVLFILPSMFVVLLGPAILNLIEQFAGGI